METSDARALLMSLKQPRKSFVAALCTKVSGNEDSDELLSVSCQQGHKFSSALPDIFSRFFNVMSKNQVSEINDAIHNGKKRATKDGKSDAVQKKIAKLQSSSK